MGLHPIAKNEWASDHAFIVKDDGSGEVLIQDLRQVTVARVSGALGIQEVIDTIKDWASAVSEDTLDVRPED